MVQQKEHQKIALRVYNEQDFALLERLLGDPHEMEYLGGPETHEQLVKRHNRYLGITGCYTVVYGPEQQGVGWVGYWESEWKGQKIWETGWNVLPEYQGKGIATRATKLVLEEVKKEQKYQYIHAFPSVENEPSNAICRKTGFELQGEDDVEYPKGHMMRCNDWRKDVLQRE